MAVTRWALQLEILTHGEMAAFMNHEPLRDELDRGELKPPEAHPGVAHAQLVRSWERRYDITPAAAIREAIKCVMASDEGARIRRRATLLGEAVRADGGSSRQDLDEFVGYIMR